MQASESTSAGGFEVSTYSKTNLFAQYSLGNSFFQFRAQSQLQRVSSGRKSLTPDRRLDPIYEGQRMNIQSFLSPHFQLDFVLAEG